MSYILELFQRPRKGTTLFRIYANIFYKKHRKTILFLVLWLKKRQKEGQKSFFLCFLFIQKF